MRYHPLTLVLLAFSMNAIMVLPAPVWGEDPKPAAKDSAAEDAEADEGTAEEDTSEGEEGVAAPATIDSLLKEASAHAAAKEFPQALEAIADARKRIEADHLMKLQEFFPDKLGEFSGGKTKAAVALGIMTVERSYKHPTERQVLRLTLGGAQGGGEASGLSGLAELGRMAALMKAGKEPPLTIKEKTARLQILESTQKADLSIFLDSGSILRLEMKYGTDGELLKKLAEEVKIAEMESYLKSRKPQPKKESEEAEDSAEESTEEASEETEHKSH